MMITKNDDGHEEKVRRRLTQENGSKRKKTITNGRKRKVTVGHEKWKSGTKWSRYGTIRYGYDMVCSWYGHGPSQNERSTVYRGSFNIKSIKIRYIISVLVKCLKKSKNRNISRNLGFMAWKYSSSTGNKKFNKKSLSIFLRSICNQL